MLKIIKDNVSSLRSASKEVELPLSKKDKDLLLAMWEHLKESQNEDFRQKHPSIREGIGLAAPQVGVNKKMLVVHIPLDEEKGEYITHLLVNPKIVSSSVKECFLQAGEGCLSVEKEHPGYVYRPYRIRVEAYDALKDEKVLIKAIGFEAIALQHEMDHLQGILFYDHINKKDPYQKKEGAVAI